MTTKRKMTVKKKLSEVKCESYKVTLIPEPIQFKIEANGEELGVFQVKDEWRDFMLLVEVNTGFELTVIKASDLAQVFEMIVHPNWSREATVLTGSPDLLAQIITHPKKGKS